MSTDNLDPEVFNIFIHPYFVSAKKGELPKRLRPAKNLVQNKRFYICFRIESLETSRDIPSFSIESSSVIFFHCNAEIALTVQVPVPSLRPHQIVLTPIDSVRTSMSGPMTVTCSLRPTAGSIMTYSRAGKTLKENELNEWTGGGEIIDSQALKQDSVNFWVLLLRVRPLLDLVGQA